MIWLLALAAFFAIAGAWLAHAALTSPIKNPEPSRLDIKDGEF